MTIETPPDAGDDLQSSITTYWNLRSSSYDAEPGHNASEGAEMDAWVADLRDLMPPSPCSVLDVGAGTGFVSTLLAQLGYRVTGLDPSEGMLAAARARGAGLTSPPVYVGGGWPCAAVPAGALRCRHKPACALDATRPKDRFRRLAARLASRRPVARNRQSLVP